MTLCRARLCMPEAMPGGELCGYHDEENEESPVELKSWSRHTKPRDYEKQAENRAKNKADRKAFILSRVKADAGGMFIEVDAAS